MLTKGIGGMIMSDVRTVKCPICGEPYNVYPFSAANQSACPNCVAKADAKDKSNISK